MIFGLCFFAISFSSDLDKKLSQFDENMAAAKNGKFSPRQIIKLREKFADFVDFHGEARQYVTVVLLTINSNMDLQISLNNFDFSDSPSEFQL